MEIKQVWQEDMHVVACDQNIVKREENKGFSAEKNEHECVAITPNLQTSEDLSVTLDLLKQSIDVASVQQHLQKEHSTQWQAMNVTVKTLALEE